MAIGMGIIESMQGIDRGKNPSDQVEAAVCSDLAKSPPKAVRGPDGKVYVIDGHHRSMEAFQFGYTKIPLDIRETFSAGQEKEFYQYMASQGAGYFTREARERNKSVTPEWKRYEALFKDLPKDFAELAKHDDPVRTTVGTVLFLAQTYKAADGKLRKKLSISPPLKDYVEFYLGERLKCELASEPEDAAGLKPGERPELYSANALNRARRAIFKDKDTIKYLREKMVQSGPGMQAAAEELLRRFEEVGADMSKPGFQPTSRKLDPSAPPLTEEEAKAREKAGEDALEKKCASSRLARAFRDSVENREKALQPRRLEAPSRTGQGALDANHPPVKPDRPTAPATEPAKKAAPASGL
jgi:hypothetical protein